MGESICLTDLNADTVRNLKHNIALNDPVYRKPNQKKRYKRVWNEQVTALCMNWEDESTWPSQRVDYIVGSDLVYQKSIGPLIQNVVNGLLKDNGSFFYVCPEEGRAGLDYFLDKMTGSRNKIETASHRSTKMEADTFKCVKKEIAPDAYKYNPLHNGDDEDAFLHFFELPVTNYYLYEFCRS